jgi:hypothetical protein
MSKWFFYLFIALQAGYQTKITQISWVLGRSNNANDSNFFGFNAGQVAKNACGQISLVGKLGLVRQMLVSNFIGAGVGQGNNYTSFIGQQAGYQQLVLMHQISLVMVLVIGQQAHLIQISLVMILGESNRGKELKFLRYREMLVMVQQRQELKFLWSECW